MSHYIEANCMVHGEWEMDSDFPSRCPQCEEAEAQELASARATIARLEASNRDLEAAVHTYRKIADAAKETIARLEGEIEALDRREMELHNDVAHALNCAEAEKQRADAAERERDSARAANERDRAGYFYSVESLRRLIARWGWVGDSERNTAMDEETCREQFTRCMAELRKIANRMERKTHARDLSDCPTTTAGVEAALAAASGDTTTTEG